MRDRTRADATSAATARPATTRADTTRADTMGRRRASWALPVAACATAGVVAAGGVVLAFGLPASPSASGDGPPAHRTRSPVVTALPPPPSKPLTRIAEPCSLVTRKTVERLVPQAAHSDGGAGLTGSSAQRDCTWEQSGGGTDVVRQARHLEVRFELDAPKGGGDQGTARTRSLFADLMSDARKHSADYGDNTPTGEGRRVYGPFRTVPGLGVAAFTSEYRFVQGPPLPTDTGAVELTAAYRNLLVVITYRGEDIAAGKPAETSVYPVPAPTLRAEVRAVAREVLTALNRCAGCRR
ncbi:hypothetical protein AB0J52_21325 [Spirillospora sp. NPDC049652]